MQPKLTIGMAHHSDYDGVYFTVQSIRLNNQHLLKNLEFVVVDQTPRQEDKPSPHSEMLRNLMNKIGGKYVYSDWPIGTSPSRNLIFDHASGEFVLVLDCHMLLEPEAIPYLIKFTHDLEIKHDLYHGVFLSDHLGDTTLATHFADVWRGEMWGIWGIGWQCPECSTNFQMVMNDDNTGSACTLTANHQPLEYCQCGKLLPRNIPWGGHERELMKHYAQLSETEEPFEIPGQGMGMFLTHRESWLGFNRDADGFGAEEMSIHEKYRQADRKVYCLPSLRGVHRFGRVNGIPYPLTIEKKVRNYVLWFNELGLPLDPIHKHFVVDLKKFPQSQWDSLIKNPKAYTQDPKQIALYKSHGTEVVPKKCSSCQQRSTINARIVPPSPMPIKDMVAMVKRGNRPLTPHVDTLIKYASRCQTVLDVADHQESTIAFAATEAEVDTFQMQNTTFLAGIKQRLPKVKFLVDHQGVGGTIRKDYDLVFLDTGHTFDLIKSQLNGLGRIATKYIIVHDTEVFPEIVRGIAGFIAENPQWSILEHSHEEKGLMVLGCLDEDKPKAPPEWKQAITFAKASAKHAIDGWEQVNEETYTHRINACSLCPLRVLHKTGYQQCSYCGCPIERKALWASEDCPHPQGSRWKTPE